MKRMKLRSREKKNEISIDELTETALEKMKECMKEPSNTSLPDVIVLEKENNNEETHMNQTLSNDTKKHKDRTSLYSSSLDPGPLPELYFTKDNSVTSIVQQANTSTRQSNDETIFTSTSATKPTIQSMKQRKLERLKFAGPGWYNMSAPEITPEIRNDLRIIQIRNSLDRSHYYKSSDWKKSIPKYFQMGTVIEDATDYYSARIPKKQRKGTIVDELLSDNQFRKYHTRKYKELARKRQQQGLKRKKFMNRKRKQKLK